MARPWSSCKLVVLALLVPLLTSCLDLAVDVTFNTSTAGQVKVDALAWRMAQDLQVIEGDDLVRFPSSRAEWQTLVVQIADARLVSWEGAEEDRGFRSTTILEFSSSRALEGLFVLFKQKLTLLQDNQSRWTLTLVPQVPRVTGSPSETRQLWAALWGTTVWTFGFTPPGRPRSEDKISLADLAAAEPPKDWTLTWGGQTP